VNASHQKVLRPKALVAALLAAPVLSACGSNFGAQTDQVYIPADGVNSREGTVDVLNALIISEEPGSGRLVAGLANNSSEEDALVDVQGAGDDQGVEVQLTETEIPASGLVQLADPDAEEVVLVTGEDDAVRAGTFVRLTFTFESSDSVELNVPVLAPGSDYEDVEVPDPSGAPVETPTDTPTDTATETPTDTATETPEG
jgi:copper(I)-binding protein